MAYRLFASAALTAVLLGLGAVHHSRSRLLLLRRGCTLIQLICHWSSSCFLVMSYLAFLFAHILLWWMASAKLIFHFVSAFNYQVFATTSNVTTAVKDYYVSWVAAFTVSAVFGGQHFVWPGVYPGQVSSGYVFFLSFQRALFKYTVCTVNVRQWQANILLFSFSFPANRLHGDVIVLQLNRGPAASGVGQRSQVLCPAQLPWRHCPVAGNVGCPSFISSTRSVYMKICSDVTSRLCVSVPSPLCLLPSL